MSVDVWLIVLYQIQHLTSMQAILKQVSMGQQLLAYSHSGVLEVRLGHVGQKNVHLSTN